VPNEGRLPGLYRAAGLCINAAVGMVRLNEQQAGAADLTLLQHFAAISFRNVKSEAALES
jgi:hypothetical protein